MHASQILKFATYILKYGEDNLKNLIKNKIILYKSIELLGVFDSLYRDIVHNFSLNRLRFNVYKILPIMDFQSNLVDVLQEFSPKFQILNEHDKNFKRKINKAISSFIKLSNQIETIFNEIDNTREFLIEKLQCTNEDIDIIFNRLKEAFNNSKHLLAELDPKNIEILANQKIYEITEIDWRPTETIPEDYNAL